MNESENLKTPDAAGVTEKSKWPYWLIGTLFVLLLIFVPIVRKSGTVIDALTGEPIEGAVVLVEWT